MGRVKTSAALASIAGLAAGVAGQTDIFWNAGSGVWGDPLNWNPQNVPDHAGENARILGPAGILVTMNMNPSIFLLEVGAQITLELPPPRALYLSNNLINNGLITLNLTSSSHDSYIQFNAHSSTISGSGTLRLGGGSGDDAALYSGTGVTVTNGAGHTIDGAGTLHLGLLNEGLIEAIDTGFGSELLLTGATKTNHATIRAADGATLIVTSMQLVQNETGVLHAMPGGTVRLDGNQTLTGGRLTADGGGTIIRSTGGTTTLQGIIVENELRVDRASVLLCDGAVFNCPGVIVINDTDSASDSYMQFLNNCIATGGGEIFLAGSGNDSMLFTGTGATLTLDPTFTVGGSGQVHATLTNNGLIRAYPSTHGDGRLMLVGGSKANQATMRAEAGGVLEISSIQVSQSGGGRLVADGGRVEFTGNPTVIGGSIDAINGGAVERMPGGSLSLQDVTLDGDLHLREAGVIYFTGSTIVNNATLRVNDTASASDAYVQTTGDCTLSGPGSLFLAGSGNDSMLLSSAGATLTLAPGATIEGSGQVHARLLNRGLVRTRTGPHADGRLVLLAGEKFNEADMVAEAGGVLEFYSVPVTQTGAGRILADGGVVEFTGNPSVSGGVLTTANGGVLSRQTGGTLYLAGATLESDLFVQPGSLILYTGDWFVNNGSVIINDTASASDAYIQFNTNTLVSGTGSIHLAGSGNDSMVISSAGVTATFGEHASVTGSGEVHARLVNHGTFRALPSENGDGRLRLQAGDKFNHGAMIAETGGVLEFYSMTLTQGTTGLLLADGGVVEFTGNPAVSGGTLDAVNGGRLVRASGGTLYLDDALIRGDLEIMPGSVVMLTGSAIENNASIIVNPTASASNAYLHFNAHGTVHGQGRVLLAGGSDDSQIICSAGATGTFGPGQTIEGEGQLHGTYLVRGVIAPGLPVGIITASGELTLAPTATLDLEADGNPGSNDRVVHSGQVALDGTLRFRFLDNFTPTVFPAVYTIVTAGQLAGDFDAFDLPAPIAPGTAVYVGYDSTRAYLAFTCLADNAPPFGTLDLSDITGFIQAFLAQDPAADLAEPYGFFDLYDLTAFAVSFTNGCP